MKTLHFISGLPRSGTTLLAAMLNQNPRFHASISSPLAHVYNACHRALGVDNEAVDFITSTQRHDILRGIFGNYYEETSLVSICAYYAIFDNSRAWTSRHAELFNLFPDAKMICMVRPINEILNSFERIYQIDPLMSSRIFDTGSNATQRCNKLMAPNGVVAQAYNNTKDAFFSDFADRILFIQYRTLVDQPLNTMLRIYGFIGETCDKEALNLVHSQIPGAEEFDIRLGVRDLHKVSPRLQRREGNVIIPPEIWHAHSNSEFWNIPELNRHGMTVL